jgi:hypothetical protein
MRISPALGLIALCCSVLLACAEDTDSFDCTTVGPDEAQTLELCDITTAECQCKVYKWVSIQRGSALLEPPVVNTITREQFIAGEDDDSDGENEVDVFGEALRLLGYNNSEQSFSEDEEEVRGSSVAAFYSTNSGQVTVIEGEDNDPSDVRAVSLLAHEFLHEQQDREGYFDYINQRLYSSDVLLAARAALEGEAEFIEYVAEFVLVDQDPSEWDWDPSLDDYQQRIVFAVLEEDNPYPLANLIFPYPYGAEMFASAYFNQTTFGSDCLHSEEQIEARNERFSAIDPAWSSDDLRELKEKYQPIREQRCLFPVSSGQLYNEHFDYEARKDSLVNRIQPSYVPSDVPEQFDPLSVGRPLGGWHTLLYLDFAFPNADISEAVVESMTDDRFYVAENSESDGYYIVWWVRLDDEDVADDLVQTLIDKPEEESETWAVYQEGSQVILTSSHSTVGINEWRQWATGIPSAYDEFLEDLDMNTTRKDTAPAADRHQLPTRIY